MQCFSHNKRLLLCRLTISATVEFLLVKNKKLCRVSKRCIIQNDYICQMRRIGGNNEQGNYLLP